MAQSINQLDAGALKDITRDAPLTDMTKFRRQKNVLVKRFSIVIDID